MRSIKKKAKEKSAINYKYVFNKVFTGSYLEHNLGHEMINFIKTDQNKRYVYLNPGGKCSKEALNETEYALHIIEVAYEDEKYYELLEVSVVDKSHDKERQNKEVLTFKKHRIKDGRRGIFVDEGAEEYTFKASKILKPKDDCRILFKINSDNSSKELEKDLNNSKIIMIYVESNPQRQIAYSRDNDINILNKLICSTYFEEKDDNVNLSKYSDEQCLAVISDRTNLENSFSNQIAYFLGRDRNILSKFIQLLNKKTQGNKINEKKEFEILREYNNIDLLLKSDEDVIVIENKIDSDINGRKGRCKPYKSQLSKYYDYIMKEKELKEKNKNFFILVPKYSSITEKKLKEQFLYGKYYNIIYYDELYDVLNVIYNPYGKVKRKEKSERDFLYKQFLEGIKYVKSSKAEQKQEIAYIRLKQRINELDERKGK